MVAKAQAEIDAVVGVGRLPTTADRPLLPYIEAMMKETMRWNPVTPLALPHAVAKDDEYEGYFFKKGTVFMVNGWCVSTIYLEYFRRLTIAFGICFLGLFFTTQKHTRSLKSSSRSGS